MHEKVRRDVDAAGDSARHIEDATRQPTANAIMKKTV
jgi:hypothetical protein